MELSWKERDRISVLRQVREGVLAAADGAARFGVTERHFRRLRRQWDSSVHAWLEDRGPPDLVLIALHDDATSGLLHGRFVERDTGAANQRAIVECLERHGRPRAVYVDHASHFGQRCG